MTSPLRDKSTHLSYVPFDLLRLGIAHGVLEARQSYPEPVEAVVRPVDCEDRGAGVGLRHPPVPLEDDDLGPDLVVDRLPFVEHLLDVVLQCLRALLSRSNIENIVRSL